MGQLGPLIAVARLVATPILLLAAAVVRFAGTSPAVNQVDYARMSGPRAFNRWAGNRLFLLPSLSLVGGLLSLRHPGQALLIAAAVVVLCGATAVRITVGAERVRRRAAGAPR